MDDEAVAMSKIGIPDWSHMQHFNLSGICATTRILQCRYLGLYEGDISRKFQRGPAAAPDLSLPQFMERKRVITKLNQHNESLGLYEQWTPVLFLHEVRRVNGCITV